MSKLTLDSVGWETFRIRDVFEVTNSKPYHKDKLVLSNNGIEYVTRTSQNNGVEDIVSLERNYILNEDNSISLGAENADFFFHENKYLTGNKMYCIKNQYINKFNGLFLVNIFRNSIKGAGFGYGKGLTGTRFKTRYIVLPIDDNGNPNWQFMEDYIKQEMKAQSQKVITYYENKLMKLGFELLDLEVEWKAFWMEEILSINSGVRLTKADQIKGDTPFIGASDSNNGVTEFIGNVNNSLDSNVLGVNYNGSVVENFYHSYECIFSDDVKRIKYKDNEFGDEFTYLFLKQMILSQKNKYKYGYKFNAKRMNRQKIMLPVNNNGEPHWEYMSSFVKKIEKENIEKILNYLYIHNR